MVFVGLIVILLGIASIVVGIGVPNGIGIAPPSSAPDIIGGVVLIGIGAVLVFKTLTIF